MKCSVLKIISMIAAVLLVAPAQPACAANNKTDGDMPFFDYSETRDFYDISIDLDDMYFKLTSQWNPDTHTYEPTASAENSIRLYNNSVSENPVSITLRFVPQVGMNITAVFLPDGMAEFIYEPDGITFILPTGGYSEAEINLAIEGDIPTSAEAFQIGKLVTNIVPLSGVVWSEPLHAEEFDEEQEEAEDAGDDEEILIEDEPADIGTEDENTDTTDGIELPDNPDTDDGMGGSGDTDTDDGGGDSGDTDTDYGDVTSPDNDDSAEDNDDSAYQADPSTILDLLPPLPPLPSVPSSENGDEAANDGESESDVQEVIE